MFLRLDQDIFQVSELTEKFCLQNEFHVTEGKGPLGWLPYGSQFTMNTWGGGEM